MARWFCFREGWDLLKDEFEVVDYFGGLWLRLMGVVARVTCLGGTCMVRWN